MKKIFITIVFAVMPLLAGAQALKGSYFLDSSLNRHEMNPAFAPRADYFQLFGIGNMGLGAGTNLDIPTFFFPKNGKLCTFLHPDVTVKEFERALPAHPHFDVDFNTTLFGFGFYTKKKSYWTFDIDVRTMLDVDLPRDLFTFVKKGTGTSGQSFNIGNVNAYAMAGVQASLGYSRDIIKGLRAGIKARVIAPLAYAGLNLENVRLTTGDDKWNLSTEGYLHAAAQGLDMSIAQGETMPEMNFDLNRLIGNGVLAGFGYSFDLGAEYVLELGTIFDGLSVSAAVTDLGSIRYNQNAVSSFKSEGSVDWEGFQVSMDEAVELEASLDEFMQKAKDGLFNLSEMKHAGSFSRSTMPRFHVGVEMPFLKRSMSVGLLYSSRLSHSYARNELTLSYNLTPCKWFALGVNYSFLNTYNTMGFVLELTPRWGPALYIGCDYIPVEFVPASFVPVVGMLPSSLRLNMNFGIAFHVGSKHVKKQKKDKE